MSTYNIMGIIIDHRTKSAPKVQEVLTSHGCKIGLRVGMHEAQDACSEEGLVILQVNGDSAEIGKLEEDLNRIDGVVTKSMSITSN